uniref:Zinc finger MYND domain-containing protein 10 n=1 Tax=Sinocyclocheilus grahami TaxID=75366 RepID=A0A672MHK0_SINGR
AMDSVLLQGEAVGYIQSLEKMSLRNIGSPRWFRQHEYIEKLNMQANLNASANQEEFIKDLFVSLGKDFNPKSTFLLYMVIHHEATIINLLETIMYHKESSGAAGDSVLDLVDYRHRKLTLLAGRAVSGEIPTGARITHAQMSDTDLQRQSDMLEFEIAIKALSVLCYITDHIESLGLSVLSRMLCTHNMPCVLVQLLISFITCYMIVLFSSYIYIYMYIYCLFIKYVCHVYHIIIILSIHRCGFLTEVVIDQLPNLLDLKHFLSQLAVTDPAAPKKDLILEQLPEIWNNIVTKNSNKWKAIAKYQVTQVFNPSESELREQASRLAQTYNLDVMEHLIPDKPKCGACGRTGAKRCSRCQGEWYCNRECQVKHWPKHKPACRCHTKTTGGAQHQQVKYRTNK